MQQYIFLSHTLSLDSIGFSGRKSLKIENLSSICCGKSSNSSHWSFDNHLGTHIDPPFHFINEGKKLNEFPANFWIFQNIFIHNKLDCVADEIIMVGDWMNEIPHDCEFLIIKTGFEKYRNDEIYWSRNPAYSPDIAKWLKHYRKKIRVIGFDSISLTGFNHRELGREAHRAFLSEKQDEHPILIVEDMKLSELSLSPTFVLISPLRVEGADGSPVTIIAKIN